MWQNVLGAIWMAPQMWCNFTKIVTQENALESRQNENVWSCSGPKFSPWASLPRQTRVSGNPHSLYVLCEQGLKVKALACQPGIECPHKESSNGSCTYLSHNRCTLNLKYTNSKLKLKRAPNRVKNVKKKQLRLQKSHSVGMSPFYSTTRCHQTSRLSDTQQH